MNYGQSYDSEELAELFSVNSNPTSPASFRPMDTDLAAVSHSDDLKMFDSMHITVPYSLPCPPDILLLRSSSKSSDTSLSLSARGCSAIMPACVDSPLDIITHDDNSQILDSISTALPSSMSCVLDSTFRPPSSEASVISLIINHRDVSIHSAVDFDNTNDELESTDWWSTNSLPPLLPSETFSIPLFIDHQTFSSERNSLDWPPTGSTRIPEDGNVEQDDVIGIQENAGDSVVLFRKAPLSPVQEALSDHSPIELPSAPLSSPDPSLAQVLDDGKLNDGCYARDNVTKADVDCCASGPFITHNDPETQAFSPPINALGAQRFSVPASAPFFVPPACEHRIGTSLAAGDEEGISSSRQKCNSPTSISTSFASLDIPERSLVFPSRLDIPNVPPPVLPKFVLPPPFTLTELHPTGIKELFKPPTAHSSPRYDHGDVLMRSVLPDSLRSSLLNGLERDFHTTGTLSTLSYGQAEHDFYAASREAISTSSGAMRFTARTEDEQRAMLDHRGAPLAFNSTAHGGSKFIQAVNSGIFSLPAHPLLGPFNCKPSILDSREVTRPSDIFFSTLYPERICEVQHGSLPSSAPSYLDARGSIAGMSEHRASVLESQNSGYDPDFKHDVAMESCGEAPALKSSEVVIIQSALSPTALLPLSNISSPVRTCSSGPLTLKIRGTLLANSAFDAPFVCERAELQNYGCLTTSSVQHRLQPLRPGLRDLSTIGLEQEVLHEDGSPCVPEMSGVGIRPNSCRVYTPPRDIPKLDYGFPIIPSRGRVQVSRKRQDPDQNDIVFLADRPANTPVGSRKRYVNQYSTDPKATGFMGLVRPPPVTLPSRKRRRLDAKSIYAVERDSLPRGTSWKGKERRSELMRGEAANTLDCDFFET